MQRWSPDLLDRIILVRGNITRQKADAIVNAANTSLLGGGGVDGAIHAAAGPGLLEECRKLRGCATGEAKITCGHNLPAKYVIHTVGPVWNDGMHNEDQLLANCYRSSLQLAKEHGIQSIAFPSISTGAYRFPISSAATIAVQEIAAFLSQSKTPAKITIVCFDPQTYDTYAAVMSSHFRQLGRGPDRQHA